MINTLGAFIGMAIISIEQLNKLIRAGELIEVNYDGEKLNRSYS